MSTAQPTTNPELHLAPGRWTLDPARSRAEFRVAHTWGLATVTGHFKGQEGWLSVDENERWSMELTLDAASIDTGNGRRDKDLRSKKFFDIDRHPKVRFRSTNVTSAGDRLLVTGELTAAGSTVTIEVETTISRRGDDLALDGSATVDQLQFGMSQGPLRMVKSPTKLHVEALLQPER